MRARQCELPFDLDYLHRKITKSKYIYIAETEHCGFGIFAAKPFSSGHRLIVDDDGDYYRSSYSYAQVMSFGLDLVQHCFQIDHDRYLLPHGSIDDLINHACDPTAGIRLTGKGYELLALRDIQAGEELTYDYSTYISNPRERLNCCCGSKACRGEVGPFRDLPAETRAYYLARGVVGAFAAADAAQTESRRPVATLVKSA